MINSNQWLKSDLLKVAHHGSITSTSELLLRHIDPEIAVISVGGKNKFDHPSPIILERLQKNEVSIYRTDELQALWFFSNGKNIELVKWQ